MSRTFCFGALMEVETLKIGQTNTELVVSAGRGRSNSDMIPPLARRFLGVGEVLLGIHSKVQYPNYVMHDIEYADILLTTEGGLHIMTQNLVQYNSRGHSWLVLYYCDV